MPREEPAQEGPQRRIASPPLERPQLAQHFHGVADIVRAQFAMATGLSPGVTGAAREWVIRDFLQNHLPGSVSAGTGHILYGCEMSNQQDAVIYKNSGLVLPLGNNSLFLHEDVLACVEVKSTLTKDTFTDAVATNFSSLKEPQPLKVLIARQLAGDCRYRKRVAAWATKAQLTPQQLPDLIIIANVGTILRGKGLQTIAGFIPEANDPHRLYKYGQYGNAVYGEEVWVGFALLIFEIATRATRRDWSEYLKTVLPTQAKLLG
jgi:hypothetical protein